ncbi:cysteine hydrolase family protein [Candidatus Foliamicus sp.]
MKRRSDNGGAVALMLIDLQNSFFHEDCENYYPESANLLPALRKLLDSARASKRPVIFVGERHRPGLNDFEAAKLPAHCVAGELDAELVEGFAPRGTMEIMLAKRRMSAFQATDLDLLLRELGVRTLVIGGVKTNVCVRATVQDGFSLGYRCHVVRDAVNSNRRHLAEASLEDIERYLGWVVSLEEGVRLLS